MDKYTKSIIKIRIIITITIEYIILMTNRFKTDTKYTQTIKHNKNTVKYVQFNQNPHIKMSTALYAFSIARKPIIGFICWITSSAVYNSASIDIIIAK